ncbi:flagellar biosynthesis protein FlgN [Thermotoga sp. KOL6]|nr:flagellar biosynthesis protein FlgN [Thermotoga sp. KOL6]
MKNDLKEVLCKKIEIMNKIRTLLEKELDAVVSKDFKRLEEILPQLEEMSMRMSSINEKLESTLKTYGEGVKLIDLLEIYRDDEEMIITLKEFFESLNKITFELQKLKQAIDFHLRYIDFVFSFQRNEITYRKDGSFDKEGPSVFYGRS